MWDSTLAFTSGYKMLIRKSGSAWFILTIALLVALLASTNAITNALSLQAETLAKLKNPEGTYILLSGNATALTDSKLDTTLTGKLGNLSCIQQILPQKIIQAHITAESSNATAQIIGVNNVAAYLKTRRASLNGSTAKNPTEANIGEILANTLSISLGNQISCTAHNRQVKIKIAGIFRSQTQSDTEIIVPLETANILAGDNKTITLIEFTLKKDANPQESLNQITQLLPENVKLIQTQQLKEFTQQISIQLLTFLNLWSLTVYTVAVAASYVIAARLITESHYELAMLRILGAKKHLTFTLILTYTITVALLGAILGTALGIAGAQAASTMLKWIQPSLDITPFLKPEQALQTLLLTLLSSTLGCLYPALKSTRIKYVEQPP